MVNSIFNYFKKPKKSSEEAIVPVSLDKNPNVTETRKLFPSNTRSYFLKDEESWNSFFKYSYEKMLSNGVVYDANYRPSPIINGAVADKIEKEISKKIKEEKIDALKFLCIEQDALGSITFPSIRMEWSNGKEVNLKDLLDSDKFREHKVKAIALCHSDENKTKGIRLLALEGGVRCYEVIDGSYEMTLRWFVGEKECKIKVLISDNGSTEFLERNGVTEEQLSANTEVIIVQNCKGKTLHELLSPQLQQKNSEPKSSEEKVKVSSQESSKIKDLVTKNPEAKSALKELDSQLQQKSSKEQSSGIKFPEKELKGVTGSRLLTNMPDPTKWDISGAVDQCGGPSTDLREVKNALLLKKGLISERTLNQLG